MATNPNDNLYSGSGSTSGSNSGLGGSGLGSSSGADSFGVTGAGAGQSAAGGSYGAGSGSLSGTAGDIGSMDLGAGAGAGSQGMSDRLSSAKDAAADKLGQAREVAGERLGQAREKASQLKATLADRLEAGANSLRQQGTSGGAMGLEGSAAAGSASNPQLQRLADTGANALQKSAQFLREGDLRSSIEEQVRTNPGRTLLIALGVGYALGKVIRGNDRRL